MAGSIEMEEDEMKIFRLDIEALPETNLCTEPACEDLCAEDKCDITWRTLTLYSFEPDTPEEKSFLRSRFAEKGKVYDLGCLMSWKDMNDTLIHFCGKGIYKGTIALKEYDRTADYVLELGQVDDTFSVKINGKRSCFPDQVMKRVEIGSLLHAGENSIEVTVVSNLYNRFFYEGYEFMGIPFPYVPRAYGMYETDNKKIRLLKQA